MRQFIINMKKILFAACAVFTVGGAMAQADTTAGRALVVSEAPKKVKKKYNLSNRANDHFLLQMGYTNWLGTPDSINAGGFSRSYNAYFMLDFPFKSSPKLSAAIGLGVGSDHVFLSDNFPNVKGSTPTMRFLETKDLKIRKTKVVTAYLEAPVELRYVSNPEKSDKSFKFALGVKVGTMIKGGTRTRLTAAGSSANFLLKESSKNYFNTTRVVGTVRVGVGHFTIFGTYQFTGVLTTEVGPQLKPYTIGLSIGGL